MASQGGPLDLLIQHTAGAVLNRVTTNHTKQKHRPLLITASWLLLFIELAVFLCGSWGERRWWLRDRVTTVIYKYDCVNTRRMPHDNSSGNNRRANRTPTRHSYFFVICSACRASPFWFATQTIFRPSSPPTDNDCWKWQVASRPGGNRKCDALCKCKLQPANGKWEMLHAQNALLTSHLAGRSGLIKWLVNHWIGT